MRKLLVLDVVGLTPALIPFTPRLAALGDAGHRATLGTILPAVTCSAQATMLTGRLPREHGIVANGWLFRELSEVWLWRQSNHLVGCEDEKIWNEGRRRFGPDFTVAKMFFWFNMYAAVDWSVTPRPVYPADGRKVPSIYAEPPELKPSLTDALGAFPLFNFWGPTADLRSSKWIADATRRVMEEKRPTLTLCYLPHLDYDLQRYGPDSPEARRACADIDRVAGDLADWALGEGHAVVALSEYGITKVNDAVHINRILRDAGLLRTQTVDLGWELLDPGASLAFAVADHQIAHVYVRDPSRVAAVKALLQGQDGIEAVLDREAQAAVGLDHARSGELVAIAAPDRWFTYYYWQDETRRPDFANTVDIHRKPGYDPLELLVDPKLSLPKLRIALTLLKKMVGFRYYMNVIGLDATTIRGSHGRLPDRRDDGPIFLSSVPLSRPPHLELTEVRDVLLDIIAGPVK